MARQFLVSYRLNVVAPKNLPELIRDINQQLKGVNLKINLKLPRDATAQLNAIDSQTKSLTQTVNNLTKAYKKLSQQIGTLNNLKTPTINTPSGGGRSGGSGGSGGVNTGSVISSNIGASKAATAQFKQLNIQSKTLQKNVQSLNDTYFRFGQQITNSARRYGAFTLATSGFINLINKVSSGIDDFIKFDREVVRIAQVTGQSTKNLKGLADEVTRLSKAYGVSSGEILKSAVTLSQAGLSANDTKVALEALAKTGVASTFGNINDTVEASIAIMQQFGKSTKDLDSTLSSINKVSAQFAVEADDITTAVRRAGGAFQAAGGDLNEFLGIFTSIRQTTRESAETIATGIRTIVARLQRPKTQSFLKNLGIDVLDNKNQFIGPYKAIEQLNQALNDIPQADVRYAKIVEEIGGIRQISKVIPLIEKFDVAQKARNVSLRAQNSLTEDSAKAQEALEIKIQKLAEAFKELIRTIGNNQIFRGLLDFSIQFADSLTRVIKSVETLIPLLTLISGAKILGSANAIGKGIAAEYKKPRFGGFAFASGGTVPGKGNKDTVSAMLTPGEYVLNKAAVKRIGKDRLDEMNSGRVKKFARGGFVDFGAGQRRNAKANSIRELEDTISISFLNRVDEGKYRASEKARQRISNNPFQGNTTRNIFDAVLALKGEKDTAKKSKIFLQKVNEAKASLFDSTEIDNLFKGTKNQKRKLTKAEVEGFRKRYLEQQIANAQNVEFPDSGRRLKSVANVALNYASDDLNAQKEAAKNRVRSAKLRQLGLYQETSDPFYSALGFKGYNPPPRNNIDAIRESEQRGLTRRAGARLDRFPYGQAARDRAYNALISSGSNLTGSSSYGPLTRLQAAKVRAGQLASGFKQKSMIDDDGFRPININDIRAFEGSAAAKKRNAEQYARFYSTGGSFPTEPPPPPPVPYSERKFKLVNNLSRTNPLISFRSGKNRIKPEYRDDITFSYPGFDGIQRRKLPSKLSSYDNVNQNTSSRNFISGINRVGNVFSQNSEKLAFGGFAASQLGTQVFGQDSELGKLSQTVGNVIGQFGIFAVLLKGANSSIDSLSDGLTGVKKRTEQYIDKEKKAQIQSAKSKKLSEAFGIPQSQFKNSSIKELIENTSISKKQANTALLDAARRKATSSGNLNPSLTDLTDIRNNFTDKDTKRILYKERKKNFTKQFGIASNPNDLLKSVTLDDSLLSDIYKNVDVKADRRRGQFRKQRRGILGRGLNLSPTAIAGFGAVTATAGNLAGNYLIDANSKRLDRGEDARKGYAAGTALQYAGTGAALGAAAGSFIPGVGTVAGGVIGGAAGAVYGFTTAMKEATDTLEKVKFDKVFDDLTKKLGKVAGGSLNVRSVAGNINSFFGTTATSYNTGSSETRNNIESNIKNSADAFEVAFLKLAEGSKTFKEFDAVAGKSLKTFSRISEIPYDELKKQIEDQIKATERSRKFIDLTTEAYREQVQRAQNLNDVITSINTASTRATYRNQNISTLSGFASGAVGGSLKLGDISSTIGAAKGGGADIQLFGSLVKNLTDTLGGPSKRLGQEANFSAVLAKQLPDILLRLGNQSALSSGNLGIIDSLEKELDAVAKKVGYSGTALQKAIISQAEQVIGDSEDEGRLLKEINSDLAGTVSKLSGGFDDVINIFETAAEKIGNNTEVLTAGLSAYNDAIQKATDIRLRQSESSFSAFSTRQGFFGKEVSLGQKENFSNRRLQLLAGQNNVTVGGLSGTINRSQANIRALDTQIGKNLGGPNEFALQDARAKEVANLERANKALEELAFSSDKLTDIQDEIEKEQRKNNFKRGVLDTLVFGGKEDQKEASKGVLLTALAKEQGIKAIPQELRGYVKTFLDDAISNGDANVFGTKASDLLKQFQKEGGVAGGVQANIATQIAEGINPTIEKLIAKFDEQVKIQQEAGNALAKNTENNAELLKTALVDANKQFLTDLKQFYVDTEKQRVQRRADDLRGDIANTQRDIGITQNLSKGIVGGVKLGFNNRENLNAGVLELQNYNNIRGANNKLASNYTSANTELSKIKSTNGFSNINNLLEFVSQTETATGFKLNKTRDSLNSLSADKGYSGNYNTAEFKKLISSELDPQYIKKSAEGQDAVLESAKKLQELGVNAQALTLPFEKLNQVLKGLQTSIEQIVIQITYQVNFKNNKDN